MTAAPKNGSRKRIAMHPASATAGRNVINIASGKGGVGKTWIAIFLSHALARKGDKVLLFDADFGLANVDVQLGLNAERDLGGVVAGRISMSQAVTPFPEGGFDIVVGKSGSGQLADMGRSRLSELKSELWQLSQRYDRVVIDLGAGLESAIRSLTPMGGMTLMVATDEPTSLTDAYA
jgi:flagellar biosynthesis protein FlhG